jgi:hypothetical protein
MFQGGVQVIPKACDLVKRSCKATLFEGKRKFVLWNAADVLFFVHF